MNMKNSVTKLVTENIFEMLNFNSVEQFKNEKKGIVPRFPIISCYRLLNQ